MLSANEHSTTRNTFAKITTTTMHYHSHQVMICLKSPSLMFVGGRHEMASPFLSAATSSCNVGIGCVIFQGTITQPGSIGYCILFLVVNGLSECTGGRIINAATGNGVLWNDCSAAAAEWLGGIVRHLPREALLKAEPQVVWMLQARTGRGDTQEEE